MIIILRIIGPLGKKRCYVACPHVPINTDPLDNDDDNDNVDDDGAIWVQFFWAGLGVIGVIFGGSNFWRRGWNAIPVHISQSHFADTNSNIQDDSTALSDSFNNS